MIGVTFPNKFTNLTTKYDNFNQKIFPKLKDEKNIHNEKFSYIVIKKGKTPNTELTKEEEAKTPGDKSFFWPRVVRPIIRKHAHVIIDLCNGNGKLERRVISKSHGKEGGYKTAKKTKWGDLWYIPLWVPNKFRKEFLKGKRLW